MSDLHSRIDEFLPEFFRLNPTWATAIGAHAHDDRWPDLTDAGRAERLAFIERWLGRFRAMADLEGDDAIDRDLLIGELEAAEFSEVELREKPGTRSSGSTARRRVVGLLAREFAPPTSGWRP
jgi:hypothetical protein